jgi:Protein of unknown function (DUF1588)/Protein of unknown function (DUF1592)/Protein of unknown function (DUF1585)
MGHRGTTTAACVARSAVATSIVMRFELAEHRVRWCGWAVLLGLAGGTSCAPVSSNAPSVEQSPSSMSVPPLGSAPPDGVSPNSTLSQQLPGAPVPAPNPSLSAPGAASTTPPSEVFAEPDPEFASPEVVASRLTRMIWNVDADPGVVASLQEGVSRQRVGELATRMLADPRAREGIVTFYRWWLLFDSVTRPVDTADAAPSEGVDALNLALRAEAPALGSYLTLDTEGTFIDLLTVPYTFMNEALAEVYGVSGVEGSEMRRVPYPAGEPRIGLLTGAGILSFFSSLVNPSWPAKRSWMITDPLLCTPVIQSFLPVYEPDVTRSIREQMLATTAQESCMGCHKILNSPGFAFIGFDSNGRWHPEPGAAPNEVEGWIPEEIMPDAPRFNGPAGLSRLLAERDESRRCFVRQWMQFARKRDEPIRSKPDAEDLVSIELTLQAFTASGLRLSSLIVAVTQSNAFLRQ